METNQPGTMICNICQCRLDSTGCIHSACSSCKFNACIKCEELQDALFWEKTLPTSTDLQNTMFSSIESYAAALLEASCNEYACEGCEKKYCGSCIEALHRHEKKCKRQKKLLRTETCTLPNQERTHTIAETLKKLELKD